MLRDQTFSARPLIQGTNTATRLLRLVNSGLYIATAALFVAFALTVPYFFSVENIFNILTAAAFKGILAAGFAIALIGGLIDTSMPGVIAVASVLTGVLLQQLGLPLPLTLLLVMMAGVLMGLFNGVMVVNARINAFIATLATGAVFFAICIALTNGQTVVITRPELQEALLARPLGIPLVIWVLVACYVLGYLMLNHTKLGAHLYAVGANYQAARLNGVPVERVIRIGLIIMAVLGTLTAALATARGGQTLLYGTTLSGYDLADTLTAVLLGGVSLFGGTGKIERSLIAVLFLTILSNGLQFLGAPTGVWFVVRGVALVTAVILDVLRRRVV